jgi:hypothetical protein
MCPYLTPLVRFRAETRDIFTLASRLELAVTRPPCCGYLVLLPSGFKRRERKAVTASMVERSEFLSTDSEVLGSIPSAIRFSESGVSGKVSSQAHEDNCGAT